MSNYFSNRDLFYSPYPKRDIWDTDVFRPLFEQVKKIPVLETNQYWTDSSTFVITNIKPEYLNMSLSASLSKDRTQMIIEACDDDGKVSKIASFDINRVVDLEKVKFDVIPKYGVLGIKFEDAVKEKYSVQIK